MPRSWSDAVREEKLSLKSMLKTLDSALQGGFEPPTFTMINKVTLYPLSYCKYCRIKCLNKDTKNKNHRSQSDSVTPSSCQIVQKSAIGIQKT